MNQNKHNQLISNLLSKYEVSKFDVKNCNFSK